MSFARRSKRRRGEVSIDLTPLIDVVFQLLIFFVLTSTFQNNPSFRVKLPKAKNREVTQQPKALVVTIAKDGSIELDGKAVDARELELRMCAAAQSDETTGVNIRADEATEHQHVVRVMDAARTCGLDKLGILHGR
ncbi:MAG: biopolymer transporter ExbD [Deltaproteobacteria bacterium]|nr:biopolymer transporter ExbD [Deltaproteobacteria bacterium]MBK8718809.1 biopolymer transporter ExbD [Deltaproteobacteria bacterium]MBP7286527.1 biopolymer transporter ExbD [Nannocystaceae bacterium]